MIFNKQTYYNHMKILQNISFFVYFFFVAIFTIIGLYFFELRGAIAVAIITAIIGYPVYLISQIKVEEMQWKLDLYDMAKKINVENKN